MKQEILSVLDEIDSFSGLLTLEKEALAENINEIQAKPYQVDTCYF